MFGFIFYLDVVRSLYFASDIFGEIPLYFARHGKALRIATEIKQFCALGINIKDVVPALPGVLYKYDIERDVLSFENYHNWNFLNNRIRFDTRKIVQLIKKSVFEKYSTIDLQKSALLLSGGLDSAILAFELAHLGLKTTFTVAADTEALDLKTAKAICDLLNLDFNPIIVNSLKPHCAIAVSETSNRSIVEEMTCHIVLGNVIRKNGIQVVFSGCGADEIFVGYQHLLRYRNKQTRKKLQADFVNSYYKMDLRAFNKIYMLNAIEVRNPFLSKNLLNYVSKLHVDELLIGRRREMKLALRQSYSKFLGEIVKIPKYIARETMGAKDLLKNNYGDSPYVYRPLLRDIFCCPHRIIALMEEAKNTY